MAERLVEKKVRRQLYEGMYILSAQLSDEARQKALARIENGITSRGGEVKKQHEWGKKRLAYNIEGHREGYYYILYFDIAAEQLSELWAEYHLNEDLVRFMTLCADEVLETIEFKSLAEQ
jgi:small subunit ribosomal protein S6